MAVVFSLSGALPPLASADSLPVVIERYVELLTVPFDYTQMLWVVLPLAATLLAMELYFGVYSSEELGWNTATGNSFLLVLISCDLFRQIFRGGAISLETVKGSPTLFAIAGSLLFLGILMFILNFKHVLPRKLAFRISSILPVNLFAYLAVVLVYSNLPHIAGSAGGIPIDSVTALACLLLFISFIVVFGILHLILPHRV